MCMHAHDLEIYIYHHWVASGSAYICDLSIIFFTEEAIQTLSYIFIILGYIYYGKVLLRKPPLPGRLATGGFVSRGALFRGAFVYTSSKSL